MWFRDIWPLYFWPPNFSKKQHNNKNLEHTKRYESQSSTRHNHCCSFSSMANSFKTGKNSFNQLKLSHHNHESGAISTVAKCPDPFEWCIDKALLIGYQFQEATPFSEISIYSSSIQIWAALVCVLFTCYHHRVERCSYSCSLEGGKKSSNSTISEFKVQQHTNKASQYEFPFKW